MATKKKKPEPSVFRVGRSPVTGKIYAGYARGIKWVGNKKDVTQSFIQTMLEMLESLQEESMPFPVSFMDGTHVWHVNVQKGIDHSTVKSEDTKRTKKK